LGLDPDPAGSGASKLAGSTHPARAAAEAVARECERLIEIAGSACVAAKPQLACFERLGGPGWEALQRVVEAAQRAGLLVIADGKRGDVPVSAAAYAQAFFGATPTPWGDVPGLGVDAATINPLLGVDAMEPLIDAAEAAAAGVFVLVRTSNPGAADLLDTPAPERPLFERVATLVAERAGRLAGTNGLSGLGAVVGATEPRHLGRLRDLMPNSVFLLPGVGAQGGRVAELDAAFGPGPASAIVTASRSIVRAEDPARAAQDLRQELWEVSGA
jgi:orotidine-5'-phosphate decarboxylase